ncbi:MAG: QueT transporter family protein [Clostridia bacterium]|nr:QueT transporter family protein [Clostridia bacterium]
MKTKTQKRTLYLCQAAVIAALYVILTFLANLLGLANGVIQIRLSEMLCLLPIFLPAAIPGVTIGCLLANLLTSAVPLDILIGPIATLIGALGTYALRNHHLLATIPPILSNALIIPFVLAYGYEMEQAIWFMMITVGVGEILSVGVLGMIFIRASERFLKKM